MGITEASAPLDTPNWAEYGVVSTNIGTLATLSACIDAVSDKLNRAPITATTKPSDAQVAGYITRAKEELAQVKSYDFLRRYVIATMTAGVWRYSLPPDCKKILSLRDTTNDRGISVIEPYAFDTMFPDMAEVQANQSKFACQKNLELWLSPPPSADVFELQYERDGDDVLASQDISWLPEIERWRCVDFATAESWELLNQYDRSGHYKQKWLQHIALGKRADNKRKFKGARGRGLLG